MNFNLWHKPSDAFLSRYEIIDKIGEGAYGLVLLARQLSLNRLVALKILLAEVNRDENSRKRFLREARILSTLSHPNIVRTYEFGTDMDVPYLVEEFLEGETLQQRIDKGEVFSYDFVLKVGMALADALACAHDAGVLHRDLKPANVFITEEGGIKLLDFGLAKRPGMDETLTRTGMVSGTPAFLAPEQITGEALSAPTDIYALGTLLFFIVSGELPYGLKMRELIVTKLKKDAPPLSGLCTSEFPPVFTSYVDRMLARKAEDRPQSAARVKEDLELISFGNDPCGFLSDNAGVGEEGLSAPRKVHSVAPLFIVTALIILLILTIFNRSGASLYDFSLQVGGDGAVLSWKTESACVTGVIYGPADGDTVTVYRCDGRLSRTHKVVLSGLVPGKKYSVRPVLADGTPGPKREFCCLNVFDVKSFEVIKSDATSVNLKIVASLPCKVTIDIISQQGGELISRYEARKEKKSFDVRLTALPSAGSFCAQAVLKRDNCRPVLSELNFVTGQIQPKVAATFDLVWQSTTRPLPAKTLWKEHVFFYVPEQGLCCFDLRKRAFTWSRPVLGEMEEIIQFRGNLYARGNRGTVQKFATSDGVERWVVSDLSNKLLELVNSSGVYLLEPHHRVMRLGADTGRLTWKAAGDFSSFWSVTETGIVWVENSKSRLLAYDSKSNARMKSLEFSTGQALCCSPLLVGEQVYVALGDGLVFGGPPKMRRLLTLRFQKPIASMLSDGQRLFVLNAPRSAVAGFSLQPGRRLWRFNLKGKLVCGPVLSGGRLYFSDDVKHIYCLDCKTGRILWRIFGDINASFGIIPLSDGIIYCSKALELVTIQDS